MILLFAIIVAVVCLDQLTKWLAVVYLHGEPSFPLFQDVLHFTYTENTGMAFGMLKDHRWVFMVLSSVAIVGLLIYLCVRRPKSMWMQVALAMIIGGGIGNMIDRIFLGYVIDFIDFTLINFAIFNVADSFVCVGAGILIVSLCIDIFHDLKEEKDRATESLDTTETTEADNLEAIEAENPETTEETGETDDERRVE